MDLVDTQARRPKYSDPARGTEEGAQSPGLRSTLVRSAVIALVLFGIVLGGIAAWSSLRADEPALPFDYEGFD